MKGGKEVNALKQLIMSLFRRHRLARNVRIKNLVYDMTEARQSPRAIEIDLLHQKRKAAR